MILELETLKSYVAEMLEALDENNYLKASEYAQKLSAARVANILTEVPREKVVPCLEEMPPNRSGLIMSYFPTEVAEEILAEMRVDDATRLVSNIPVDRAADIVALMPDELANEILSKLTPQVQGIIRDLMHFEPGTAGAAMTSYFLAVKTGSTVKETLDAIHYAPSHIESRSYVYIVNGNGKPLGVISVKDLIRSAPDESVEKIMETGLVAVRTDDSAIEAAKILRNRRLQMMPVLDDAEKIVGVIILDDAIDILTHNVADQFVLIGGGSVDESFFTPPVQSVKKRLPWMAANIFLNLGAVAVITSFEDTIAQVAALAVFLPMITDMGGNVGIQSLSVSIRSIALGEVRLAEYWKAVRKEIIVGLINGLALGVLFTVVALVLRGDPVLGLVAGTALAVNVFVAGVVGGTLPFLIKKLGKDPAMMTGPVLTTITDITGVSIYLGLSTIFLTSLM